MKDKALEKNPASKGLDALPVGDMLDLILNEEEKVASVVRGGLPGLARAVGDAVKTISGGGKVFYIGAGTSGRLGVLDASEIPPTFGRDDFKAIIAGGKRAVFKAVEGAEDDKEAGTHAASAIGPKDMAVGISASGRTPFVLSALDAAYSSGAKCWLISCSKVKKYPFLHGLITLPTGPEILSGSTRMKAGTATKIALNMLSTAAMIRLGGAYDGLMVDVVPSNRKLVRRAEDIIMKVTGSTRPKASRYLKLSGMRPKTACVMIKRGVSRREAERLLEAKGGSLRAVMD